MWKQINEILIFSLLAIFVLQTIHAEQPLKINIFSSNNGKGLEADRQILRLALEELGHEVHSKELWERLGESEPQVDINIFFEQIYSAWFPKARINWFVPNPDLFVQEKELLTEVDLILCRTREGEKIFKDLGIKNYYLGFTSWDRNQESTKKDYSSCIHVAGASPYKGTSAVLTAWHQKMPNLIILFQGRPTAQVQNNVQWIFGKIADAPLRYLQNNCGIHICPSEIEGFGHYIMEGMSAKAVVVTTDGPPMNEFVKDKRCLVPYVRTEPVNLANKYFVDPIKLEEVVQALMQLPEEERRKIGETNRTVYLEKTNGFYNNLEKLMAEVDFDVGK